MLQNCCMCSAPINLCLRCCKSAVYDYDDIDDEEEEESVDEYDFYDYLRCIRY